MNNCNKCNAPKNKCNKCNDTHLECHPCYNTMIEVCNNQEHIATPIPDCINPEYCAEGCDEVMDSECINTRCGTLAEVIDILLDDNCLPITEVIPTCEPLGAITTLTACTEEITDIKAGFLALNSVDATGVISFISGPEVVISYPTVFNTPGTYLFEYKIYSPCYNAQLITVNVENCIELTLEITSSECVNGTTFIQGTYSTNGSEPTVNVLTSQMITNVMIGGGVFSFQITDAAINQLVTLNLMNEVTSNSASVAIEQCLPCTLNIEQISEGCLNELSIRSQVNNTPEIVDVVLSNDNTVFEVNFNCILDKCGVETVNPMNNLTSLDITYAVDISNYVVGISFIDSFSTESISFGINTINLNPSTTGNSALLYQASIINWVSALKTEIQDQFTALGISTLDYFLTVTVINNILNITFRVKHAPIGNWAGIPITGTLSENGNIIPATFLTESYEINCREIDDCGNFISYSRLVDYSNIDFTNSNYNSIILTGSESTTTEVTGNISTSYCPLEITLSAVYTGSCETPTFLWNTGANTQTITNVLPGTYTVTVNCGDCVETASYTIVADCTLSTKTTYNCTTGVILFDTDWDSVTLDGNVINSGDTLNLEDGTYLLAFISTTCGNQTNQLTVNCTPDWIVCSDPVGNLICNTTSGIPTLQNGIWSIEMQTNLGQSLFITYNLNTVPGYTRCFDGTYSIRIDSVAANGVISYTIFGPNIFITDIIDNPTGLSIPGPIC